MQHIRFATSAGSRRERNRQWCAITRAEHVELADDHEASIVGGDIGALRLCTVAMGGHRLLDECPVPGSDAVKLVFQEEGECLFEQDGQAVLLGPGHWIAYRKARPHRITASGFSRQTALVQPLAQGAPAAQLMRRQSFLRGPGAVLHASVAAALATLRDLDDAVAPRLGDALGDLLELTFLARSETDDPASREARRRAAADFVERNLDDMELDVARIAAAVGCSKRTLHKLFIDQGITVSRMIWARRLARCRSELADPALGRRTITEIAHRWGFSDSQHFSRAFKAQFGVSPRDFRNQRRFS